MRGRKPKPLEQAAREGNPRKKAKADLEPIVMAGRGRPPTPAYLNPRAKRLWGAIVRDMERGNVLDKADAGMIEGAAVMWARAIEAGLDIDKRGTVYDVVRVGRDGTEWTAREVNPNVRIERDCRAQFARLAEMLGLSPVARARLGIATRRPGRTLDEELADLTDPDRLDH